MTDQPTLLLETSCRECGSPVPYSGVGRPRVLCDSCRPASSLPPVKKVPEAVSRVVTVREHTRRVKGESPIPRHVAPTARATDPETSHTAALRAKVTADNARGRALIELALAASVGLTDFELAARTGKAQTSIGVRRKELVTLGLVERAPLHPRPSPSGTPSIVWRCTTDGYSKARELTGLPAKDLRG